MTIVLLQAPNGTLYTHEGLTDHGLHRLVDFHTHQEVHMTDENHAECIFVCIDA